MKLHLACGTVYLDGYVNIDLKLPGSILIDDVPDKSIIDKRTVENYYSQDVTRDDFLSGVFHNKIVVCDMFCDITKLNKFFSEGDVDEILAVQVFEHFTYRDGREILEQWVDLLNYGGKIYLDIPDLDGTIDIYATDNEWATRLLYGSQKNEYGIHKAMYTKETATKLFKEVGLKDIEILNLIDHNYPAFCIKGIKH